MTQFSFLHACQRLTFSSITTLSSMQGKTLDWNNVHIFVFHLTCCSPGNHLTTLSVLVHVPEGCLVLWKDSQNMPWILLLPCIVQGNCRSLATNHHYARTGEIFHLPTAAQGFAVSDEMSFPAECYRAEVLTSNHCHYPVLEATLLALLKAQFVHFHFGILQDKPLTITHR